jgi:predicted SprT family Zn-dependent metalloprotease
MIYHTLRDPDKMAVTECGLATRVCTINMNPDYELTDKIARFTELHEMCHVDLFVTNEYELNQHGPKFQRCMLDKAVKHGFDDLW